jgi:hypothetical protein
MQGSEPHVAVAFFVEAASAVSKNPRLCVAAFTDLQV